MSGQDGGVERSWRDGCGTAAGSRCVTPALSRRRPHAYVIRLTPKYFSVYKLRCIKLLKSSVYIAHPGSTALLHVRREAGSLAPVSYQRT